MSFKRFIYYCGVSGAWAAFIGWAFGRLIIDEFYKEAGALLRTLLQGMILGAAVGMAMGFVDAIWNRAGHRAAPVVARSLIAGTLGCACGLLGSVMGQFLFRVTEINLLLILGWGLTGLLVGGSVGIFDLVLLLAQGNSTAGQMRKIANGLFGGFVGGLLGGLLSAGLGFALSKALGKTATQLLSSSAWGFVALGCSIGLFIGLAQVMLREAWIRIESGVRAGREILLSKGEVAIGRAESCEIGLFGDPNVDRLHARIVRKNDDYLIVDAGTPAGTFVNGQRISQPIQLRSGDAIHLGRSVLRFGERRRKGTGAPTTAI